MTRRVRVTVEGDVVTERGRALRVAYTDSVGDYASLFVDSGAEGVTVEDVEPPRVWTDGDAVQWHATVGELVWTRHEGAWLRPGTPGTHSDRGITAAVARGDADVLLYQHGESEAA